MQRILVVLLVLAVLAAPKGVFAQEQICTQAYGGGVVCGAKTHTPVNTGLVDNPSVLGASFLLVSGTLFLASRKLKRLA